MLSGDGRNTNSAKPLDTIPGRLTIRDVARVAGVGVGTISRVLNDSPQVSPRTRQRVMSAIRRLGFRPDAQARRFRGRRAEMVCFLLSNRDFLHPFHARILQGVEHYASSLRQHVVFAAIHYSPDTAPERISLPPVLHERGLIDGLILAGTIYPNFLKRIESMQVPYVALSNNVFGLDHQRHFDQVGFDDFKGAAEATAYLIQRGHKLIAFLADTSYPWFRRRMEGYQQAMRARKLKPIIFKAKGSERYVDYGQRLAERVIESRPRPTAIVAGNDEIAYGLRRSFRRRGVSVPDDISLVGFDDREEALLMDPPLTTLHVHREAIGETAMRMLLDRIHHPDRAFSELILPTELVLRESVRSV